MSDPAADAEIRELVERIAGALRREQGCQRLLVALAARAGWSQTRRLVLARVHRDGGAVSGAV